MTKLFISNKEKFDRDFPTNSEIHKRAYKELLSKIADNSIPIILAVDYGNDSLIMFSFQRKADEIYFYEYIGIAS